MFEIENYWKRATYFWAFQLVAFTFLGFLWPQTIGPNGHLQPTALMIPAGLGAVTALVGLLTAKGSKFWQENWEGHVDALEGGQEGRLTQVILIKKARAHSVSRVNERLLGLLTFGWGAYFLDVAFQFDRLVPPALQPIAGVVALAASMAWVSLGTKTNLRGWRFGRGDDQWRRTEAPGRTKSPYLVLRDTSLKPAISPSETGDDQ